MSQSEDEDNFLSADEDIESDEVVPKAGDTKLITKAGPEDIHNDETVDFGSEGLSDEASKALQREKDEPEQKTKSCKVKAPRRQVRGEDSLDEATDSQGGDEQPDDNDHDDEDGDGDDEEEEEALAERIRERNLKIARNFSVEIAKNLQASAPIPVQSSTPPRNREDSDITLDAHHNLSANLPPAPPPTPALSSSFSNLNEPSSQPTCATAPSLSTKYSWRIPHNVGSASPSPTTSEPRTSSNARAEEQAKLALDRLSEKFSQPKKSIFEQVAADIKSVAIKGDEALSPADVASQITALPSAITDLGSTLGSWGWSGATTLLSSATQVTSQVGSVLNSVSQQLQPTYQLQDEDDLQAKRNAKDE